MKSFIIVLNSGAQEFVQAVSCERYKEYYKLAGDNEVLYFQCDRVKAIYEQVIFE